MGFIRRKGPNKEAIAARVAKFVQEEAPAEANANVQPLNPGFFQLERMRTSSVAKARSKTAPKLKG
jgi:hypothetical protein